MSDEQWRERISRARREVDEARKWRRQVDDAAAELRVRDAWNDLLRVLSGMRPVPPEVREAQRRLDEFCEDHPGPLEDPVLIERDEELQRQVYAAEAATGYGEGARLARKRQDCDANLPDEEDPVTGDWFDARRAQVWGVIQSDGTVVAKGFVGDETADEDQAVYPAGALAYYSPDWGWTNAATGHPASEGPAPDRPLTDDEKQARTELREAERQNPGRLVCVLCRKVPCRCVPCPGCGISRVPGEPCQACPAKPPPDLADLRRGRWYDEKPTTNTSSGPAGGSGMASIEEVRAGIMAANESANEALGAVQQAHASLETAQGALMRATEGSGQADVSEANGMLAQALSGLEEVRQQVAAAISAAESVGNRL